MTQDVQKEGDLEEGFYNDLDGELTKGGENVPEDNLDAHEAELG